MAAKHPKVHRKSRVPSGFLKLARRPNIAFALTGILLSGAGREFAMGFSLARSVDIVTVEKIDDQLAAYGKELRDEKTTSQRTRQLVALVDDALEQRRMLTHG